VEPVHQKLAGPIGHRREKEMKSQQIVVAKYITNPEKPKTSDITNPATIYASEYEYKTFIRMVEKRVKPILETQQSNLNLRKPL